MPKIAIVTQSYKADLKECELLCESIDRFVGRGIPHYIFVNDEDYDLFCDSKISNRHIIKKKSSLLPKGWINVPWKLLGHKYYIAPLTIPVREWIIQQICKLGAFECIDGSIDAVINIDSETIFMRPFDLSKIYKDDKYVFFREIYKEEPSHLEYCKVAKKLLNLKDSIAEISKYCYMSHPTIFVKKNLTELQQKLSNNQLFSWKYRLANTYRFSEYYLYGIFTDRILSFKHHYLIEKHLFPLVNIGDNAKKLQNEIEKRMNDVDILGVWLQKHSRNNQKTAHLEFEEINKLVHNIWERR